MQWIKSQVGRKVGVITVRQAAGRVQYCRDEDACRMQQITVVTDEKYSTLKARETELWGFVRDRRQQRGNQSALHSYLFTVKS